MSPRLEETIYFDFITSSSTGAAADADSTPTAEVFEDATDTAILSPTVTKRTSKTGNYRIPVACTAANGFEEGKTYNVVASATVGAVAAKAVVATFQVRSSVLVSVGTGTGQISLSAGLVTTSGGGGGSGITVGANAVYAGPINNATGAVTIWRGEAKTLPWIIEDYAGDTQHGDAISLRFLLKTTYNALSPSSITSALTKTATASLVSGTLTLSFPLLTTETDDLSAGANGDGSTTYRVQVINTTRDLVLIDTTATVRRRIE